MKLSLSRSEASRRLGGSSTAPRRAQGMGSPARTLALAALAAAAGFARRDQWVEAESRFAVTAFDAT